MNIESVTKPFHGGQLLEDNTSPFHKALTRNQCIQYCLDRPAVLTVVPGVRGTDDLDELLKFNLTTLEERDYSVIGQFTPEAAVGNCVYCNHCQPCLAGIDIGIVNKYYDKLKVKADACLKCGHCDKRYPFKVEEQKRMQKIDAYFGK